MLLSAKHLAYQLVRAEAAVEIIKAARGITVKPLYSNVLQQNSSPTGSTPEHKANTAL
jgi:hypothetical protein